MSTSEEAETAGVHLRSWDSGLRVSSRRRSRQGNKSDQSRSWSGKSGWRGVNLWESFLQRFEESFVPLISGDVDQLSSWNH
jgi:hypothetical protein